jgi:hypothetical protein
MRRGIMAGMRAESRTRRGCAILPAGASLRRHGAILTEPDIVSAKEKTA